MKTYKKISAFIAIVSLGVAYAYAQPNTGTSLRRNNGAVTTTIGAEGCYREERVWVEGRWETGPGGRKTWREGGWAVQQVPVPCPPPVVVAPGYCPAPSMSPAAFDGFMNTFHNARFESDRVIIAKQMLSVNCVNVHQVVAIMNGFGFESSRLEIAKFAYSRACDPQNYFMVNDAFRFSSSIRELNRYIHGMM